MTMLDVTLHIFRYKPGEPPHYDTFTVQVAETAHVIDAIDAVWATHDRSLTFRRACHHSSCGSCALRIDGVEKLPCITREAEPFLPLSADELVGGLQPQPVELPDNLSRFNRFENCIECGLCMSACPTMAADDRFLGPAGLAALYRARQKTGNPREVAHLLALADGEHGVWRCHSAFECLEACPQAADPVGAIMALRRELTLRRFKKKERGT